MINILLHDLKTKFKIEQPKILVCGLNPHAGENGYLGREEIEVINPVLEHYRAQDINMSLSLPADTLFTPENLKDADAVLAMYHDQGLPVLKSQGFGEAINITLVYRLFVLQLITALHYRLPELVGQKFKSAGCC